MSHYAVIARLVFAQAEVLSSLPDPKSFVSQNSTVHLLTEHPGFVVLDFCGKTSVSQFSLMIVLFFLSNITRPIFLKFQILYAKSFQGYGRQLALQRFLAQHDESSELPCLPSDVVFPEMKDSMIVIVEDIGTRADNKSGGLKGMNDGTFGLCRKVGAGDKDVFCSIP